jgi:4'-phosphopantetheinyl transferase
VNLTQDDWHSAPARLILGGEEVHIWLASLDVADPVLAELADTLSPEEESRAQRFHFERHRSDYRASHGILRDILARYLPLAPAEIRFITSAKGKPMLAAGQSGADLQFNLSHSGRLALYGITVGRPIGVDVEQMRENLVPEEIAARFFSARENAALRALPPAQQRVAFFNGWTRKEAYLKACGEGLGLDTATVEVTLAPCEAVRFIGLPGPSETAARWALIALGLPEGYAGAVAVERPIGNLKCWKWEPKKQPLAGSV